MLKLLKKSEIDKAKSLDRQRDINEGLKLATRVDSLREVSAQEEVALTKFRTETLAQIGNDIMKESKKLDKLKEEVKEAESKKAEAQIPLDTEWEKVKSEHNTLADKSKELEELKINLDKKVAELEERSKSIFTLGLQATSAKNQASDLLRDADNKEKAAEMKERKASETLASASREANVILAKANEKEGFVNEREKAVFKKEEELRKKEIDLAKEWSLLKDRQQMFIKTKKLKK